MDIENANTPQQEQEQDVYRPRPLWQLIAAWAGAAIVAVAFILYLINIATAGGL